MEQNKKQICNKDKVEGNINTLQLRIQELERWFRNQDRQIRFLEKERQKLSALVNHTDAGFIVLDSSRYVLWINKVLVSWLKSARAFDPTKKIKCYELLGRDKSLCTACPVEKALHSGVVAHGELKLDVSRGLRHIYKTAIPIRSAEGEIEEVIIMLQDVTDLELLRHSKEVLKEAKEAAESANRSKSEFLANMSHEIRTPMTGVIGMTELLIGTQLSEQQREFAEIIKTSAHALLTLLNDILDFSKIEAGRLVIEPIPFDLRMALDEVMVLVAEKAKEKSLELIVHNAPDIPYRLIGDPGRIRQVLINLVDNAIKFTNEGHVFINIEKLQESDKEAELRISVEDTGIGIPEDKLEHIFDKFAQANGSMTRKYGGTGLGLAISNQLVEMMGGKIRVRSREGEGSRFSFTLKLPIGTQPQPESLPAANLKGARILVVQAHKLVCRVLAEQICGWGARCDTCESGDEAIDIMHKALKANDPYQIAILDYNIAGMPVEALASAIKANPDLHDTVLVMLTSVGQKGDAKRLKDAGFDAYLTKPARPSQLMDTLESVWSAKSRGFEADLITRHTLSEIRGHQNSKDAAAGGNYRVRILLAEDDSTSRKVAVKMLEKRGFQVDTATNGREVLQMLDAATYHLIIMDCEMPEIDGFEATREIRQREQSTGDHIPIIAVTARAMRGDQERCLEAGMDDYLTKPIVSENLVEAVGKFLKLRMNSSTEDK